MLITAKGLAKAQNFLLSFFKASAATTIKVSGREELNSGTAARGKSDADLQHGSSSSSSSSSNDNSVSQDAPQRDPSTATHSIAACRSGLLQYDVEEEDDEAPSRGSFGPDDDSSLVLRRQRSIGGGGLQRALSRNSNSSLIQHSPSIRRLESFGAGSLGGGGAGPLPRLSIGSGGGSAGGSTRVSFDDGKPGEVDEGVEARHHSVSNIPHLPDICLTSQSSRGSGGSFTASRRSNGSTSSVMYGSVRFGDSVALPVSPQSDQAVDHESPLSQSPITSAGGVVTGRTSILSRSSSRLRVNSITGAQQVGPGKIV